jgi:heterodisulfide reductase subunit B
MIQKGKQRIWSDFQKDIPDDNYFFARSCIRQSFFPAAERVLLDVLRNELHKDFFEDERHTTCGGIAYHCDSIPQETIMTIVARQFSLMKEAGYKNYAVSCVTSFGIHTEIIEMWREFPELLTKIRELLWQSCKREFDIPDFLVHTSDFTYKFRNQIAERAKYRFTNISTGAPIKVVEHIGCHYSKMFPSKSFGGSEYPCVLSGLVESLGGEIIDYPERRHCCGFGFRQYIVKANRGYSISNTHKKFESMEPYEPDMIITNCPGCNYFMDRWQYVIAETTGKTYGKNGYGIPVLSFEEVSGLVMGFDPWDIGLQLHQVAVEPLLDKIGVKYDPSKKYLGPNGKNIGMPKLPSNIKLF